MTNSLSQAAASAVRPPLLTRALLLRFVSMVGSSVSFFLLLSAVPAHAGRGGAGLATGALMLSTVLGELAGPWIVARYGNRGPLMAGLFLLGAPAFALPAADGPAGTVTVCLVRGLGFALTLVAGGALTAALIPAERRGEGLALVGLVGGVPSLVALPLGVWLAGNVGYGPVTVAAGVAALATVPSVPALREATPEEREAPGGETRAGATRTPDAGPKALGMVGVVRLAGLRRPAVVFAATALAAGILVTFLPLAASRASAGVATAALLVQSAASTAARWAAGRYGDRHGPGQLVAPGLLLSAAGMSAMAALSSPVAVLVGAAVFGTGFGVAQNATLALMYSRVSRPSYGTVCALWNLAYDGGMGAGAAAFGLLAGHTGYPWAFALTAVLMLGALAPAVRDRREGHTATN
ncbi:MFS transporter [Streptomyces cellostaticus]|uniref:MFS transporter n=1 Tax=Streptomyces cellostaticus TaxID=67285 RepID=A0A101NEH7_9ACTN|nr:MFS transporter [Streptomyces cellostaticus]KUM91531.1 MFS transporter [Streptomyces cellostaticus]GHI04762.1 MFS transporter [Streptomyces cellostaticus]